MRKLSSVALATALLTLGACDDSTGNGEIWRTEGVLNASGAASVLLPRDAGTPNRLPALSCYTADPLDRVWYQISSVQLPNQPTAENNCILEPDFDEPNRLRATIEGETPGWLFHFVVVY